MFLLSRGGVHWQGGPCFFFREGGSIGMGGPLAWGGGGMRASGNVSGGHYPHTNVTIPVQLRVNALIIEGTPNATHVDAGQNGCGRRTEILFAGVALPHARLPPVPTAAHRMPHATLSLIPISVFSVRKVRGVPWQPGHAKQGRPRCWGQELGWAWAVGPLMASVQCATACLAGGGGQGCIGRGGGTTHPPSRAPSLCPATVPLAASASFNGICNRQQPPLTALATSSNHLSNRFWVRL